MRICRRCATGFFIGVASLSAAVAQSISTVREAEFRSRWTDFQVDKIKAKADENKAPDAPQTTQDFISRYTQFGPLEFHGGISAGWEYSNEQYQLNDRKNVSNTSFFLAPSLVAIYEKELGSWNAAARYSVGWLYYLDPNYSGSNGDITTSQTANLSLLRDNERLTVRSLTNASSGTGFDIERGAATDRSSVSESFSAEYQLAEFLRTGFSSNLGYDRYSTPGSGGGFGDSSNYRYAVAVFVDNFLTEKTAYRLELSAGSDVEEINATANERTYAQGIVRINWGPTSKLAFTGSLGLGVRDQTQTTSNTQNGLRSVYSLTTVYTPSEKTSIRLYLGIEGASSQPEFTLAANWHPREFTFLEMSIYQQTGLSNFTTFDERLSKGFLLSFRQRFFTRIDTTLSGGYEQIATIIDGSPGKAEAPYYFIALGLGWQLNQYLSFQSQFRTSSRRNTIVGTTADGLQSRITFSLGLTF